MSTIPQKKTGIMELFESDKYKSYLQTMSRFHKYSGNNTLLISMQKSDATLVAGFSKWREGFSGSVKKVEKGIKIIAPTPYKIKEEREKLDPQTKTPLLDASGKAKVLKYRVYLNPFFCKIKPYLKDVLLMQLRLKSKTIILKFCFLILQKRSNKA